MPKIRISSGDVRRRDQTVYFYLIQLSYTAEAWKQQVEQTRNVTNRLDAVKQLIAHLGGSLANYHFFEDTASPDARAVVARDKFIGIGADDLIAVMAVPDHEAATAFSMAVSAETGVKNIRLTPITPIADAVGVMAKAAEARQSTGYSAPGGAATSWIAPARTATRKRRAPPKGGAD
jgi:uncharacterized protein with GYD domain